jgi:quercetin dioxygenase-like cupin family protein
MGVQPKKPTIKGPTEWFTGEVWIDGLVEPHDGSKINVGAVHFTPGARTAWHSHTGGQTLYVTEGNGLAQSRGEEIVKIGPGDVLVTPDGEVHWHGAAHEYFMTHISITVGPATWGDHVTDDEYGREEQRGLSAITTPKSFVMAWTNPQILGVTRPSDCPRTRDEAGFQPRPHASIRGRAALTK